MSTTTEHLTDAARHYAEAYAAHYTDEDLLSALRGYRRVIELHPDTVEARDARAQIRNIVHLVVPDAEQLDTELAMALHHLECGTDRRTAAVSP